MDVLEGEGKIITETPPHQQVLYMPISFTKSMRLRSTDATSWSKNIQQQNLFDINLLVIIIIFIVYIFD